MHHRSALLISLGLLSGILFTTLPAYAQNPVPNPSFETKTACPYAQNQLSLATPWITPAVGTPDYFNGCGSSGYDVPTNHYGYANARTGVAYAGILTFFDNPSTIDYREYVEAPLNYTLIAGKSYEVKVHVQLAEESRYATDAIGVYFSPTSLSFVPNGTVLPYTPQVRNPAGNILTDETNWVEISGTFVAAGNENYIVVGSYRDDANTGKTWVGGSTATYDFAYYYVDDIEVSESALYWKADVPTAQTGMPDFPAENPGYSGATAAANCLWWYDAIDPTQVSLPWELRDLLFTYFGSITDQDPWCGTDVHQMAAGLVRYFWEHDPELHFYQTVFQMPDFDMLADSLEISQDLILLIGNWWYDPADERWYRDGGRYVTMAGVDAAGMMIALSDPEVDHAEDGFAGRVRPPFHVGQYHDPRDSDHWIPVFGAHDYPVSHDIYQASPESPSPGGNWYILNFPRGFSPTDANCPVEFICDTRDNPDPSSYPYHGEVEYAVMVCPGEPIDPGDTCTFYKQGYLDYAPNGIPDFDQKQDSWTTPVGNDWSWCGPTALANCLWWFDSKFETNPVDPRPFYPDPNHPGLNDNYNLVESYAPAGEWDDHDMSNVVPFINDLKSVCNTDGPRRGTVLTDLEQGVITWLANQGMAGKYSTHLIIGPEFDEIRDSILSSQNVILLLGFYEITPGCSPTCEWFGSHYVTAAGVCEDEPIICLSDPYFDFKEYEPPAGSAHGADVHNDAGLISGPHGTDHHDGYEAAPVLPPGICPSPAKWMFTNYPNIKTDLAVFENQNPISVATPYVDNISSATVMVMLDAALIICPCDSCYVLGDFDGNGIPLTVPDLQYIVKFVNGTGPPPDPLCEGDLNGDGYVDQGDVDILLDYFQYGPGVFPEYPVPTRCNPDTVRGGCIKDDTCMYRSPANCLAYDGTYVRDGFSCECDCGAWGDVNDDGGINPIDVVYMVNYVYKNRDDLIQPPNCPHEAGDVNCDAAINPIDVVRYVNYVYKNITPFPCGGCD